jgi:hypothetical protein
MTRRRRARHLTTAMAADCAPRRWASISARKGPRRRLGGKAKEAGRNLYVQGLQRQVHRRKRQWKRQQEELRVLQ